HATKTTADQGVQETAATHQGRAPHQEDAQPRDAKPLTPAACGLAPPKPQAARWLHLQPLDAPANLLQKPVAVVAFEAAGFAQIHPAEIHDEVAAHRFAARP